MYRHVLMPVIVLFFVVSAFPEDVAVFPVVGVNADQSYIDAFGMLLAKKYEAISGQTTLDPIKAGRALGPDSNYTAASQKLGVSEYIELTAIGLFISRKEKYSYGQGDSGSAKMIVVIRDNKDDDDDDDDEDEDDDDQELLDNNKTVVTAIRRDNSGNLIHKAELTLVTYGDIEEASDRFALALHKKITVEEARSLTNITRREGMGHNQLFAEKVSGIKVGAFYPIVRDGYLVGITAFGYNMRMESEKFFVEFGANARIPSSMTDDAKRKYGGFGLEVGSSYFFTRGTFGLYGGGGVVPHFNFGSLIYEDGLEMGLAPYLQFGITFPRNSRTRFYFDMRIAQNVLPIHTGVDRDSTSLWAYDDTYPPRKTHRPCEMGMNIGIGW
ncbi:MAG: hypothetical protein JXA18_11420 [Chitinispirillaceae bacterium]|nr:hypothetical protein [Chitinispirillaceae bacterium]